MLPHIIHQQTNYNYNYIIFEKWINKLEKNCTIMEEYRWNCLFFKRRRILPSCCLYLVIRVNTFLFFTQRILEFPLKTISYKKDYFLNCCLEWRSKIMPIQLLQTIRFYIISFTLWNKNESRSGERFFKISNCASCSS